MQLRNVVVEAQGRVVLDIADLEIYASERVAVIGANGAGKSTLLRLLTGLVPCSGSVTVLKHTVHPALGAAGFRQLRAQVAQVMQGVHLVARLSALDNVLIGCLARTSGLAQLHALAHGRRPGFGPGRFAIGGFVGPSGCSRRSTVWRRAPEGGLGPAVDAAAFADIGR